MSEPLTPDDIEGMRPVDLQINRVEFRVTLSKQEAAELVSAASFYNMRAMDFIREKALEAARGAHVKWRSA